MIHYSHVSFRSFVTKVGTVEQHQSYSEEEGYLITRAPGDCCVRVSKGDWSEEYPVANVSGMKVNLAKESFGRAVAAVQPSIDAKMKGARR